MITMTVVQLMFIVLAVMLITGAMVMVCVGALAYHGDTELREEAAYWRGQYYKISKMRRIQPEQSEKTRHEALPYTGNFDHDCQVDAAHYE